ncbi:hypothetical protein [Streptomyces sp. NPDC055287]
MRIAARINPAQRLGLLIAQIHLVVAAVPAGPSGQVRRSRGTRASAMAVQRGSFA